MPRLLPAVALALVGLLPPAAAQIDELQLVGIPAEPEGWVTDLAGVLDEGQEAELDALIQGYAEGSGQLIAVLTVPTLKERPIEDVAREVGRAWKIGQAKLNDGALLLLAPAEREVRIEVGYGLEGDLPDAVCGRIIRDVMVPRFQDGDLAAGLRDGLDAIHRALGGEYVAIPDDGPVEVPLLRFGSLVLLMLVLFFFLRSASRGMRRRGMVFPFPMGLPFPTRRMGGLGGLGGGGRSGGFGGFGRFGGGGGFSGGGATGRW